MHAKQMQALDAIPEIAARLRGGLRPPLRRARAPLPHRGRRDDRRRARLGARHDRGGRRRAARGGRRGSARSASRASARSRSTRSARRCRARERVVVLEKALAVGARRDRRPERADWRCPASGCTATTVIAGLGGRRSRRRRCATARRDAHAGELEALIVPRPRHRPRRARARARCGERAAPARTPRTSSATSAPSRARRSDEHAREGQDPHQALPDGHLRGRQPPARPRTSARCRPSASARTRSPPGTAPARAAARRSAPATRSTPRCARRRAADRRQRDRLPRGLLDPVPRVLLAARPGSTRCSATRRRSRPASPRR